MKDEKLQDALIDVLYNDLLLEQSDKDCLFEMSSLSSRETGLKTQLNVMQKDDNNRWKHWVRVKVKLNSSGYFPILIDPKVEPLNSKGEYDKLKTEDKLIVDDAVKYLKSVKDVIMAYWDCKFDEYTLHKIINGEVKLKDVLK